MLAVLGVVALVVVPPDGVDILRSFGSASAPDPAKTRVGNRTDRPVVAAPDFERQTVDGSPFHLSDYRGRVVVLNFWATWCGPCRVEMPELASLQRELGAQTVRFVGASVDEEGFAVVEPYVRNLDIPYPLVIAGDSMIEAYDGVPVLPTTFVIDARGAIRQRFVGLVDTETLRRVVERLVESGGGSSL